MTNCIRKGSVIVINLQRFFFSQFTVNKKIIVIIPLPPSWWKYKNYMMLPLD